MVTKRELAKKIENHDERIENLEKVYEELGADIKRLSELLEEFNERILACEGKKEEAKDLIRDWLTDDRVEAVQGLLKGGK